MKPHEGGASQGELLEMIVLHAYRAAISLIDSDVFEKGGLSAAEWAIVKALANRQDVQMREIVAASGISRQRLRKLLIELEQKGAVTTNRSETLDKRARLISSTPAASVLLAGISERFAVLLAGADSHTSERGLAITARSVRRIADAIRLNSTNRRLARSGRGPADGPPKRPRKAR